MPPTKPELRPLLRDIALAVAAIVPGLLLRSTRFAPPPPVAALAFGIAVVGAAFLLSWAAEGETHVAKGLVIAVLALVTVLPEYSVDIYLAYQAGANPGSDYVQFAAANMTGANRLLVGVIWPLLLLVYWARTGISSVSLRRENDVEIAFLALASAYAFAIVLKKRIDLIDFVILIAIFGAYIWRVSRVPEGPEEPAVGPAAVLVTLPKSLEHTIIAGMGIVAAGTILLVTEPFTESLIATGEAWNVSKFLLIQWLAPLASESPVIVVTVLFARRLDATAGLTSLISDKINQWTLLVGMLPLVYSIGARRPGALPLDARQGEEFFLTAAQSLFALALLLRGRLGRLGALALLALFVTQISITFALSGNEALDIRVLTYVAWLYLVLAVISIAANGARALELVRTGLLGRPGSEPPPLRADQAAPPIPGRDRPPPTP